MSFTPEELEMMFSRKRIFNTLISELEGLRDEDHTENMITDQDVSAIVCTGLSLGLEMSILGKMEKGQFLDKIEYLIDDGWKKISKSLFEIGAI